MRTNHYLGSQRGLSGVPQRGFGTLRPGGVRTNAFRLAANVANTNVVLHAGGLFALWEAGKPHRLDPDSLDTVGLEDFGGLPRRVGSFSAHPKLDPVTGDLYNFGWEILPGRGSAVTGSTGPGGFIACRMFGFPA